MKRDGEAFLTLLKQRNPLRADMVDEQIKESNFLLQNRFDDIWFFDQELIRNFNSLLFDMVVNFY
jgi:hypothetical protein